jgi:GTPase
MQKFEVYTDEEPERAILVGIDWGSKSWPLNESLDELVRLAHTAGAQVVGTISQKLDSPNPRTFIGSGKTEDLVHLVEAMDANLVIIDDELTPSQQNNLEKIIGKGIKIIDRTALILDIFALHASSKEGKLQVRLAQNQYLYPRLRGMWSHLASNRMGGGVGSRFGEGESQLEVDRRLVRKRISKIKRELEQVSSNRLTQRKKRQESGVFRVALAGYTNAGKSSLMNKLTDSDVLAYDKLFATLDSTTRQLCLDNKFKATLTDTVGFIQKLPTNLIEAFKSTLDEIKEADFILIVVDSSSSQKDAQLASVQEVLSQICADEIPSITVFNKIDLIDSIKHQKDVNPNALFVSALTGEGLEDLKDKIKEQALLSFKYCKVLIPYNEGSLVQIAHEKAYIENEEYIEEGIALSLRIPSGLVQKFEKYFIN